MEGDGISDDCNPVIPSLLGWSQGAMVAQLTAQLYAKDINKLVLFGSLYDRDYIYKRQPIFSEGVGCSVIENTKVSTPKGILSDNGSPLYLRSPSCYSLSLLVLSIAGGNPRGLHD